MNSDESLNIWVWFLMCLADVWAEEEESLP